MTQEEKAEAYDEALNWMRELYPRLHGATKEDAEHYFPQLRESEDERIRKELIDQVQYIIPEEGEYDEDGLVLPQYHERINRYRAYLEKQKTSEDAIRYVKENHSPDELSDFQAAMNIAVAKAYDKGVRDTLEKQKEHQFCSDAPKEKSVGGNFSSSHKDKNLDEIAQDYVDGVKQYNPEPTWDLMQTAVCYGANWRKEEFEKNRLANCDALSKEECDRETDFAMEIIEKEHRHPTFNDAINYGMRLQKEQKPSWSEEDENRLNAVVELLENTSAIHPNYSRRKLIIWLKSLRTCPSWKPSEDEERLINTSISFLKDFADKGYENAVECIDWLKSKLNGNSC